MRIKGDVIEYLRGSFAYLHKAAAKIEEKNAANTVQWSGSRRGTIVGLIIDAVAHSQNHYGQMVEYLRMNDMVPPASRSPSTRPRAGLPAGRLRSAGISTTGSEIHRKKLRKIISTDLTNSGILLYSPDVGGPSVCRGFS